MAQQTRVRKQSTITYAASSRTSEELRRGMIYRELYLTLNFTLNPDGTNAITNANTAPGDEWGLVQRIDIIANGSDVLRSVSGEELAWLNLFWFGNTKRAHLAGALAAAASDTAYKSTLVMPFWMPNSIRPMDTALDASKLSDLRIEVTWGTAASVSTATGLAFAGTPTLEVWSLESFGMSGNFAQSRISRIQKTSVAANTEFAVDLPVGSLYRALLINTKDTDGHDTTEKITNIKIVSGTTVFFDIEPEPLRESMMIKRNIRETHDDAGGAVDNFFASAESRIAAWHYIDLVSDGYLSEAIDTLGLAEFKLILDIAATDKVTVLPYQVIPIRQNVA